MPLIICCDNAFTEILKNKTTDPISSKRHTSATANKAIHCLKWGRGLQNHWEHHIILTKYDAVHPTVVSEKYSSSGVLQSLIKVQTVSILSNFFADKYTNLHILYLKWHNDVFVFTHIISKMTKCRICKLDYNLKYSAAILRKNFHSISPKPSAIKNKSLYSQQLRFRYTERK